VAAQEHCEHVNERINWFAQADSSARHSDGWLIMAQLAGQERWQSTIARLTVASESELTHDDITKGAKFPTTLRFSDFGNVF
jgi:hypothetical protein